MKTQTQVTVQLSELKAEEALANDPEGFVLKIFLACSKKTTKVFRLTGQYTPLAQTLKVRNIQGKQLEFWLCTGKDKIIANAILCLPQKLNQLEESTVELKMTTTTLAHLSVKLTVSKRQIEKLAYVEDDEQLLKKVQDPYEKQRKEQQQVLKQKELQEQQKALKQVKKPPITYSKFNKRDVPFV